MRKRPSARLLVIGPENRILLFRFVLTDSSLAAKDYWATPGGSLEGKETYAEAARRELFEETGFVSAVSDTHVSEREFILQMPGGEEVLAQERFFISRVDSQAISNAAWTAAEKQIMVDHKWWSIEELKMTTESVFPENLLTILGAIGLH